MGFTINEKINTELNYKDVVIISGALRMYIKSNPSIDDDEPIQRAKNLIDRLGKEIYNCPQDDKNSH